MFRWNIITVWVVGKHIETKPNATGFIDGIRYLDIDYGTQCQMEHEY